MEELTEKQEKLFNQFMQILRDESSLGKLQDFINLLNNNKIQNTLDNIDIINKACNGDKDSGEVSINELRENIKTTKRCIDSIYQKIFTTNDNGENESQALLDIQDAQNKAKELQKVYGYFYDTKDSHGHITQGIIIKSE